MTSHRPSHRPGITIVETLGALVMLTATLTIIAQLTLKLDAVSDAQAKRDLASHLLQNAMEQAVAKPWRQVSGKGLADLALPEADAKQFKDAVLTADVKELSDPVAAKRVKLTLFWSPAPGAEPTRLSLTTFVYARPEGES